MSLSLQAQGWQKAAAHYEKAEKAKEPELHDDTEIDRQAMEVMQFIESQEGEAGMTLLRSSCQVAIIYILELGAYRRLYGLDGDGFVIIQLPRASGTIYFLPTTKRIEAAPALEAVLQYRGNTSKSIIHTITAALNLIARDAPNQLHRD